MVKFRLLYCFDVHEDEDDDGEEDVEDSDESVALSDADNEQHLKSRNLS